MFSVPERPRPNPPLHRQYADRYYWYEILNAGSAIYLKYNAAQVSPVLSFQDLLQDAFVNVKLATLSHAIIDVRNNSGGNSTTSDPLIAALQQLKDSAAFPMDRVFVIIGRETFSSGLLAALAMKRLGVTTVGEPTGNKPNHFGDVTTVTLNNSRLVYNHSTKVFSFPDFSGDTLNPDIAVAVSSVDYVNERDPVVEAILAR